jgi:D-alanine transaminase
MTQADTLQPLQRQAYLNGEFLPLGNARISVLDRGFLFGDGVYEVIPVYASRLFRLEQHLLRLDNSLRAIGMQTPLSHPQWRQLLEQLIALHAPSVATQRRDPARRCRHHGRR